MMSELEALRNRLGLKQASGHCPQWRVERSDERFAWPMDGDRGVALLDRNSESLELRCSDPASECPPAVLPKHYHVATQKGVRILSPWRLKGKVCGEPGPKTVEFETDENGILVRARNVWSGGHTRWVSVNEVCSMNLYDPGDGYNPQVPVGYDDTQVWGHGCAAENNQGSLSVRVPTTDQPGPSVTSVEARNLYGY